MKTRVASSKPLPPIQKPTPPDVGKRLGVKPETTEPLFSRGRVEISIRQNRRTIHVVDSNVYEPDRASDWRLNE